MDSRLSIDLSCYRVSCLAVAVWTLPCRLGTHKPQLPFAVYSGGDLKPASGLLINLSLSINLLFNSVVHSNIRNLTIKIQTKK